MAMTLITNSADTDSTDLTSITFDSGIDSTYKLYIFKFIDINPATNNASLSFQVNASGQSGYNEVMTTSTFIARHTEDDGTTALVYDAGPDQAQGTSYQLIMASTGNVADESGAGTLWLFNPSTTTYVKHFYSLTSSYQHASAEYNLYVGGYINTTAAIDEIDFKMSSGNMDGVIKMYGVG